MTGKMVLGSFNYFLPAVYREYDLLKFCTIKHAKKESLSSLAAKRLIKSWAFISEYFRKPIFSRLINMWVSTSNGVISSCRDVMRRLGYEYCVGLPCFLTVSLFLGTYMTGYYINISVQEIKKHPWSELNWSVLRFGEAAYVNY